MSIATDSFAKGDKGVPLIDASMTLVGLGYSRKCGTSSKTFKLQVIDLDCPHASRLSWQPDLVTWGFTFG
jgi:hypothetical protein